MNPLFFLALRSLRGNRSSTHSLFSTTISLGVISLGVAALIVVTGVMSGFHEELQKRILSFKPHLYITSLEALSYPVKWEKEIKNLPSITRVTPVIWGEGMLKSLENSLSRGVIVKGLPEKDLLNLYGVKEKEGAILGKELLKGMGLKKGDRVFLITSSLEGEILYITGILNTGMYQIDNSLILLPLKSAQRIFRMEGRISGLEIRVKDPYRVEKIRDELYTLLPPSYQVRTWKEMDRVLFSALKLEKITMFAILSLLFILATFSISSSLVVKVMERKKDIGILRTIGFTPSDIKKIYLFEGIILGLGGGIGGGILALVIESIIKFLKPVALPGEIYSLSFLPVKIEPLMYLIVLLLSITITLLATLFPAVKASRIDVSEVLRYE